jgi:hypothetical protein
MAAVHDTGIVDGETVAATSTTAPERRPTRTPSTLVWVLGGVVVVALVVGVVAAALRPDPALDPATPEGVVQSYLQAVLDRDYGTAVSYLAPDTAERCTAAAFRDAWVPDGLTAELDDVSTSGDRAQVRVVLHPAVELAPVDPTVTTTELFTLERTDAGWRLVGTPWPLTSCGVTP